MLLTISSEGKKALYKKVPLSKGIAPFLLFFLSTLLDVFNDDFLAPIIISNDELVLRFL